MGMSEGAMLTTIDYEPQCQLVAKKIFEKAGYRVILRFINDRALNILPRLAKNAYDVVVIDGKPLMKLFTIIIILKNGAPRRINNYFAQFI